MCLYVRCRQDLRGRGEKCLTTVVEKCDAQLALTLLTSQLATHRQLLPQRCWFS